MDGSPVARTPLDVELSPPSQVLVFLPGFAPVIVDQGPSTIRLRPLGSQTPAANRSEAWLRLRSAVEAARANDCATVATISAEVRDLDAALHENVFTQELTIARCAGPLSEAPREETRGVQRIARDGLRGDDQPA